MPETSKKGSARGNLHARRTADGRDAISLYQERSVLDHFTRVLTTVSHSDDPAPDKRDDPVGLICRDLEGEIDPLPDRLG